jgi:hypothetical protein
LKVILIRLIVVNGTPRFNGVLYVAAFNHREHKEGSEKHSDKQNKEIK